MERKNQTVLITGASRGIGRAIAIKLASEGYDLHLTCRNNYEILQAFAAELRDTYGVFACAHNADAGCDADVELLFLSIKDSLRPYINILINNAGIAHFALLQDMSSRDFDTVVDTNLKSCFLASRKVIPGMVERQFGRIVNISSVWGRVGSSMESIYSASKGGVDALTRALARELAPSHIAVNAIACGMIDTDMNACLSAEDKAAITLEIPMGRMGTPEEIAETVSLLLRAPEYLTGQIIGVDGGWT